MIFYILVLFLVFYITRIAYRPYRIVKLGNGSWAIAFPLLPNCYWYIGHHNTSVFMHRKERGFAYSASLDTLEEVVERLQHFQGPDVAYIVCQQSRGRAILRFLFDD